MLAAIARFRSGQRGGFAIAVLFSFLRFANAGPANNSALQPGSELSALKLVRVICTPFRFQFGKVRDGRLLLEKPNHEVTLIDFLSKSPGSVRTCEIGVGEKLPPTDYVITKITPMTRLDPLRGVRVDASEVQLRHMITNIEKVWTVGKIVQFDERSAEFETADSKTRYRVRPGDSFQFPKSSGTIYHVVDVANDHALLRRQSSAQVFRIQKAE